MVLVHWSSYLQSSNIHTVYSSTVGGWEAIVMVAWCAEIIWCIGCFNVDYATASDEVVYMSDGTAEWDILNEGKNSFIL